MLALSGITTTSHVGFASEVTPKHHAALVPTLKAMGIADLLQFDFLDPPDPRSLVEAMAPRGRPPSVARRGLERGVYRFPTGMPLCCTGRQNPKTEGANPEYC